MLVEDTRRVTVYGLSGRLASRAPASIRLGEDTIRLSWTTCHYGGRRVWFLCPRCNCRVAILYSSWGTLACRSCLGISYACQADPDRYRWEIGPKKERERLEGKLRRAKQPSRRAYLQNLLRRVLV